MKKFGPRFSYVDPPVSLKLNEREMDKTKIWIQSSLFDTTEAQVGTERWIQCFFSSFQHQLPRWGWQPIIWPYCMKTQERIPVECVPVGKWVCPTPGCRTLSLPRMQTFPPPIQISPPLDADLLDPTCALLDSPMENTI